MSDKGSLKKHPINIKLDTDDYNLLRRLAAETDRSITNYVIVIVKRELKTARLRGDGTSQTPTPSNPQSSS